MEDINKIVEEEYQKKLAEINRKYDKKLSRNRKKIVLIPLFTILTIILIPFLVLGFVFGITELGWFANYDGMHQVELPIEAPAKGGTLYIPDDWSFVEKNGWYEINDKNGKTIAYEIYHGYELFINNEIGTEWVDYEVNAALENYNIEDISFTNFSNGANSCIASKSNKYLKLSFTNACYFKKNSEYNKRQYTREYLFIDFNDEALLKKISASYIWGGEVN